MYAKTSILEQFLIAIAKVVVPLGFAFLFVAVLLICTGMMDVLIESYVELKAMAL